MLLVFDPDPPFLRWCKIENQDFSESRRQFGPESPETVMKSVDGAEEAEAIGYILYHGGEVIRSPQRVISGESLAEIQSCIRFLPEHNNVTFRTAQYWMAKLPDTKHILFCDTAFFTDLPAKASTYAVPYQLRRKGIKRYGGFGLCHQWAWEKTRSSLNESVGKMVSIYLGDYTNIAAIEHGKPVETSIGFTSVEGILSANSCGDIDPTVVLNLSATGMSFEEINRLVSHQGGFTGLLGKECSYVDIMQDKSNPEMSVVRQILSYSVMKYIGAFISILGGVDAISFTSEHLGKSMSFISEICHKLEFLGLECRTTPCKEKSFWSLTESESEVSALGLEYNKWTTISDCRGG